MRATLPAPTVNCMVRKLRIYAISDQDDAGPWIRRNFPDMWWIVSLHAFRHYDLGGWGGRYGQISPSDNLWTDTSDYGVVGKNGQRFSSRFVPIWRWREAY